MRVIGVADLLSLYQPIADRPKRVAAFMAICSALKEEVESEESC